jgi:hypothetical protein
MTMKYEIVKNMPVARFWYKGTHTHPVRRTVLVVEQTKEFIRGYELREGRTIRTAGKAPVKTYRRDRIAKGVSLRTDSPIRKLAPNKSTLVRKPLLDIIESGA